MSDNQLPELIYKHEGPEGNYTSFRPALFKAKDGDKRYGLEIMFCTPNIRQTFEAGDQFFLTLHPDLLIALLQHAEQLTYDRVQGKAFHTVHTWTEPE
jgi:hypothetical protein